MNKQTSTQEGLRIERVFDAPRDLVWKMWTNPDHFKRWMGPRNFTTPHCTIDLRPGGRVHFAMRDPDGKDYWSLWVIEEMTEPERILYIDSFSNEMGEVIDPAEYGMQGWPRESRLQVTFEDLGSKTKVITTSDIPAALAKSSGAEQGWNESLDKLEEALAQA